MQPAKYATLSSASVCNVNAVMTSISPTPYTSQVVLCLAVFDSAARNPSGTKTDYESQQHVPNQMKEEIVHDPSPSPASGGCYWVVTLNSMRRFLALLAGVSFGARPRVSP